MSKIEQLLKKLCPNGVEHKKLGEVAILSRGASPRPISAYVTDDPDGAKIGRTGSVALLGGPIRGTFTAQSPGLMLMFR